MRFSIFMNYGWNEVRILEDAFLIILVYSIGILTGCFLKTDFSEDEEAVEIDETKEKQKEIPFGFEEAKTDKPNFMEQLMNVMNYSGENQKEEVFDEEN